MSYPLFKYCPNISFGGINEWNPIRFAEDRILYVVTARLGKLPIESSEVYGSKNHHVDREIL